MARRMRDEENESLHVRPWRRNRRSMPQWLVALPAAAVIGFLAGFFTGSKSRRTCVCSHNASIRST